MSKLISALIAAAFAAATINPVLAADEKKEAKKPTAEECKKDPKIKGCEPAAKK